MINKVKMNKKCYQHSLAEIKQYQHSWRLVGFYNISSIVGYLMLNPVFAYIIYNLSVNSSLVTF